MHLYSQQQPKFAMASDLERELLARDNETSPSISAQPSVLPPSTTVPASLAMDASGTQQLFQQFLKYWMISWITSSLASKEILTTKTNTMLPSSKKLKLESKATSSFKFKGNKIQYEFNVTCIDSLEKVSKCVLDGDLSKASDELQQQISSLQKETSSSDSLTRVLLGGLLLMNISLTISLTTLKRRKSYGLPSNVC